MHLSDIRRLTPITHEYAYYQTSGFSPKTDTVIDETNKWARFHNQGPAAPGVHEKLMEIFEATRVKVARSINAEPDEILLGENTTIGINVVANGIDWQPGDNMILTTHEHPGNRIPWYNFIQRYGVELRFVTATNDGTQFLAEFESRLDERTRLASISHVSRRTGVRFPVKEMVAIAQRYQVPTLLDGAQSYGAIPVDVKDLDCEFYTFSGHKYIMAPQGTGGCYIRQDMIEWVKPSWIGSHSQADMDLVGNMTLHDAAKRFEFGTRNLADQAGFGKALDMWEEIGWENVFAYIESYTDKMKAELREVPGIVIETPESYEKSAGIVTFYIPGFESLPIMESLQMHEKVLVSTLEADTTRIRVSTHVFNTDEEVDRLVSGLCRIVQA